MKARFLDVAAMPFNSAFRSSIVISFRRSGLLGVANPQLSQQFCPQMAWQIALLDQQLACAAVITHPPPCVVRKFLNLWEYEAR